LKKADRTQYRRTFTLLAHTLMGRLAHDPAEERKGVASSDFSEMRIPKKPPLCPSSQCRKSLGDIVQVMDGVVQEVAPK